MRKLGVAELAELAHKRRREKSVDAAGVEYADLEEPLGARDERPQQRRRRRDAEQGEE
jgi:hypothetical protein